MLNPNNYENFKPFLTETERKKLEALKEDDNPCLLKLYFKEVSVSTILYCRLFPFLLPLLLLI